MSSPTHHAPTDQTPGAGPGQPAHPAPAAVQTSALPCHRHSADLWFAEMPADVEAAKALCRSCPIRPVCLAGALQRREPWGVWGGELLLDGVVVARKRGRGRPRKDSRAA